MQFKQNIRTKLASELENFFSPGVDEDTLLAISHTEPMSLIDFISRSARITLSLLALFVGLFTEPVGAATPQPPNIVFILIDDMGWADAGCYGSKFYQTPNLDQLAAQGMKFTDAHAACPVCSPTRASIMTGKYPARLHLTDWLPGRKDMPSQKLLRPEFRQGLPLEEITVAESLKTAGYVTASIGKWHLGGEGFEPQKQGFDLNIGGDHTGTPLSYFAPFKNGQRTMPGLETSSPGEYLTDRLTTEAEKFIEQNQEKPFFLYLPHYAVHTPLKAKSELIAKYQALKPTTEQTNAVYAAMIESMDESVGRIVRKLDALKLSERTIVIFTSDNGGLAVREGPTTPSTSNAPLREGKGYLYEGGIRVPLIVRWPGVVRAGSVCATPVSSIDFQPTLLAMAKLKPAAGQVIDGVNLMPVLQEAGELKREALYWHYPHYANQGAKPGGAIRQGDFKLIEFYEDGHLELYNLKDDLGERTNLAEKLPQQAMRMEQKLDAWRRAMKAQMMLPNPDYRGSETNAASVVVVPQSADGTVLLHAKDVSIHGTMVRYEPQPNKNTVGYWVKLEDWVSWDFQVTQPGRFQVEILQGCGKGSGGSEVAFSVGSQTLTTVVEDTGHFQNFIPRKIGEYNFSQPGRYTLSVRPKTKPGAAVMDLRAVTLKPVDLKKQ